MNTKDNGSAPAIPRPALQRRRRFYKHACAAESGGLWRVELDGRPLKTRSMAVLSHPSRALMEAIAAEWDGQGEEICMPSLQLTRLANTGADGVRGREDAVIDDMLRYACSDVLLYRAEAPADLVRMQAEAWDGVLAWADGTFGAAFTVTSGIMPVEQPREMVERLRPAYAGFAAFALTALHCMTTLTGSAVLALAHAHGRLTLEQTWQAAHVDENYQIARWGLDSEAEARRELRLAEMTAASQFLRLC
jgi:chaperone required for assembly of F1-ATPase